MCLQEGDALVDAAQRGQEAAIGEHQRAGAERARDAIELVEEFQLALDRVGEQRQPLLLLHQIFACLRKCVQTRFVDEYLKLYEQHPHHA